MRLFKNSRCLWFRFDQIARENIKQATEKKTSHHSEKCVYRHKRGPQKTNAINHESKDRSGIKQTKHDINVHSDGNKDKNADTQTNFLIETKEIYEYCVSRMDRSTTTQEETHSNVEPPTISGTHLRFEASHELMVEGLVATFNKETNTEIEDDTPQYKQNFQKVLGVSFIAAANRKERNMRLLADSVKKRDWEALKRSFG